MEFRKSRSNHTAPMRKDANLERKNDRCVSPTLHRKDKMQRCRHMGIRGLRRSALARYRTFSVILHRAL
ncbi:hypothetical protein, partial [Xanthomonas oryzae]|uniref:hypothetical protein n=1 Tax=Xanthomonas oryzae TaxID=347 RepID=UPI001C6E7E04